ncbi:MAG: ABC transporter ATP-binding protein, partial [Blastocatellia bacterium]
MTKKFRGVAALNELDLTVPEGSVYALVGPNGAGKTTTLKIVMNILRPSSGHSEILGIESNRLSPAELAAIGYVSENQQMPDWMTVNYFLAYLKPFYPAWDSALEGQLVRQFDLPLDRKLKHLSRGMRMKAALASSLAYRPRLIILDEPFTGLDALVRDELIEALLELAVSATVLISSHDLAEIEHLASHVGYLDRGRLLFSEEMTSLIERFREVEVTFEGNAELPTVLPEGWMRPNANGAVVRFVDSRFDPDRSL